MKRLSEQKIDLCIDDLVEKGVLRGTLESAVQLILMKHRSETDMSPEVTAMSFLEALKKHHLLSEPDQNKDIIGYATARLIEDFLGGLHQTVGLNQWGPWAKDPCEVAIQQFATMISRQNALHDAATTRFRAAILRPEISAPR